MGKLIYSMSVSLDGFAATKDHSLDWVHVDEELHEVFNEEARQVGTFLYGRRMWELMSDYWPTGDTDPAATPVERDFARIWRQKPKVVFSRTLDQVDWNARLVREDAVAEVAQLKASSDQDMDVGGPTLAASIPGGRARRRGPDVCRPRDPGRWPAGSSRSSSSASGCGCWGHRPWDPVWSRSATRSTTTDDGPDHGPLRPFGTVGCASFGTRGRDNHE